MKKPPIRRLLLLVTLGAIAALIVMPFNPVHNTLTKTAYLSAIAVSLLGLTFLSWSKRWMRIGLLSLGLVAAVPFLMPGRPVDSRELHARYLEELRNFEGCVYHWGGESRFGIDCSGLPRRSLINALAHQGVTRMNGTAIRRAAGLWWHDASALAISEGHRDETIPLGIDGKLKELDLASLSPGDLAVTKGGAHLLVYLGDGDWIQADPGAGKVLSQNAEREENPWFSYRVTTHRWKDFRGPQTATPAR